MTNAAQSLTRALTPGILLAQDIADDLTRAYGLACTIERSLAYDVACARKYASEIIATLATNPDHTGSARVGDLLGVLYNIHTRTRAYDREIAYDLTESLNQAINRTHNLVQAINRAKKLDNSHETSGAYDEDTPQPAPLNPAARRLADIAARVLPAAHRARYRDEYRSELHDIAATGASWWQQVAYAVRLLDRSWELRYELRRSAARRS